MRKLNVRWRSARRSLRAVLAGAIGALLLGGSHVGATSMGDSEVEVTRGASPNPGLFPPQSHPLGFSMETWAENWWRYLLAIPAAQNPFLTQSADCSVGQGGPVFFIPPVTVGSVNLSRSCIVEHGKAVAITLSSVLNDYPCPDPTFQPAPGQSLFDFLLAGAVSGNGDIAEIDVTLDGQPLNDILSYHFASHDLMFFKGDLSLQSSVDACITGTFQPAAVDSYFIIFKPLPRGHHTIVRRVVTTTGRVTGPTTTELDIL
jgi:hypothetical protein